MAFNFSNLLGSRGIKKVGAFDIRVWDKVSQVPYGRLAKYGQTTELINGYSATRQIVVGD
tara:strand:- start:63 stop:242 length:180 start_codon:yes stop_codon:yes gene_type:complete